MGVSHWSPNPKNSNSITTTTTTLYEWEMNFHHSLQIHKKQERKEQQQEEEEKARCEWDFNLRTIVTSTSIGTISDTLGVTEFDPSDHLLATGGIARKIRIYNISSLLSHDITQGTISLLDHNNVSDYNICTPAKLSSLRWKPDTESRVIGSGDYDGVITEYDLEQQVSIFERDEHGGRRVWSIDYSQWGSKVGASGSDDGTMHVWDTRTCGNGNECVAVVQPTVTRSPVCCVEFDPFGSNLIGVGCADTKAYTYDVRKMSGPTSVLIGHQKTVSYVRFLGEGMMVSAAIDGCLKLWEVDGARVIRTYKGHSNSRNFVGLSVWRNGGLIGCGSESDQVFVYDKRWGSPIWVGGLEQVGVIGCDRKFVSSVCWRQSGEDDCTLATGGSDGNLQVFVGKRRSS